LTATSSIYHAAAFHQPVAPQAMNMKSRPLSDRSRPAAQRQDAFTMFEVLLVIVALGLLAALVVPTVDRFFDATGDTAKTHNAQMLNQYMETLYNSGVNTSSYADGAAAIAALTAGVTIPATVPGGQTQDVRLRQTINPAAYTFTAGTATRPPVFAARLGDRTQRP
jgi:prepilin-type N-terminal cleavage/methylation domain-containing protein